jgi:hypothetical protein
MLTRLFAYVIFSAAFGAIFGIALRALATARGWSGGKSKGVRRVEAVVIIVTAVFWLLAAPIIVPFGTDLLTALGMEYSNAFTLVVSFVVPCNALLGVAFGWIIGPEPSAKSPAAPSQFVPFGDENSAPTGGNQPPLVSGGVSAEPLAAVPIQPLSAVPAEPRLEIPDEPPMAVPVVDDSSPSPFAGMRRHRSEEELWSSYGRDALFLSILSLLLLAVVCVFPGGYIVAVVLAGIVGIIAMIMAIRALVVSGSRSTKGMAFAIVALVLSAIPLGLAFLSCLFLLLALVGR